MTKQIAAGLLAVGALAVSTTASAAIDLSAVTGAFTAADIVTGVLAIAGTLAVVYVTIKGAKIVLGMLRGG